MMSPRYSIYVNFVGLLSATVSSEIFRAAQPALLYLVPFTLLPLLTMAYLKVSYLNPHKPEICVLTLNHGDQRFFSIQNHHKCLS